MYILYLYDIIHYELEVSFDASVLSHQSVGKIDESSQERKGVHHFRTVAVTMMLYEKIARV